MISWWSGRRFGGAASRAKLEVESLEERLAPAGLTLAGPPALAPALTTTTLPDNPSQNGGNAGTNAAPSAPVLTSVTPATSKTFAVQGTLNATANTSFRIDFFAQPALSPSGQDVTPLSSTTVTTDSNGSADFTATVGPIPAGQKVTATATDTTSGDTSSFSAGLVPSIPAPPGSEKPIIPVNPPGGSTDPGGSGGLQTPNQLGVSVTAAPQGPAATATAALATSVTLATSSTLTLAVPPAG